MQQDLHFPQDTLRLVRVGPLDARLRSDDFLCLREVVMRSEEAYPSIAEWFDTKVTEGLRVGGRMGWIALINERAVAAAVLKRGQTTKICHLKVDESMQSRSLGDLLFSLMAIDVRHQAKRVRFTLPESVWEDRKNFFSAFGFSHVEKAERQYRLFDTELYAEASYSSVFDASKEKLPHLFGRLTIGNHSLLTGAVLAVHPGPLEMILSGKKTVELRTRFSKRWEGRRVSLYATQPSSGLAGEATVSRVIEGHPAKIWEHFGSLTGCTRADYEAYVGDRSTVQALLLTEVRRFPDLVPLEQLRYLLGTDLPAPQSYLSLENHDGWLSAVVLAAALQGSIRIADRKARHGYEGSRTRLEVSQLPERS